MEGIYVDYSYRTLLGTGFYNRLAEQELLEMLTGSRRLLVVYGPRNVGKSELIRYFLRKKYRGVAVAVDARRLRAKSLEERVGSVGVLGRVGRELAGEIMDAVSRLPLPHAGVIDLVVRIGMPVGETITRLGPLLVFIDEFHELPGYRGDGPDEALGDLRSLAGILSKTGTRVRVLVAVSEGFAATTRARSMLEGYSTGWLLVEHLDRGHFEALYREYTKSNPCHAEPLELYSLVGGAPGLLPDLCPLSRGELEERIALWIEHVERALSYARSLLESRGISQEPRDLVRNTLRIIEEPLRPLPDHHLVLRADILVERNIVYPKRVPHGIRYTPHYPVYRVILREAVEEGVESLLDLDPATIYRSALSKQHAHHH